MSTAIPDEVIDATGEHWGQLGLNPVFIYRLCERGFLHCEIDFAMRKLVGEDWLSVNAGTWIDRMAASGNPAVIHSLAYDTPPLIEILYQELCVILADSYPEKLCPDCKKIHDQEVMAECDA